MCSGRCPWKFAAILSQCERHESVSGHRRTAEIALVGRALQAAQSGELAVGFYTFGNRFQTEASRERNDRLRDCNVHRVVGQAGDERAVDLELISGNCLR